MRQCSRVTNLQYRCAILPSGCGRPRTGSSAKSLIERRLPNLRLPNRPCVEAELKAFGRLHYASASGSLHRCVAQAYDDAKAKLRLLSQLQQPPAPPARRQPPRSPDAVVNDIASLTNALRRLGDTYLGEEREEDTTPEGNK
jgi:hypothetical protein